MFSFLSWDFGNRPPRRNDGGLKVRPMVSQLEARDVPSVVYDNGFQGAATAGGEWSARAANGATVTPTISTTPVGNRQFLGQFGNSTATLSLAALPTHNAITISFDLYVINSWDGSDVLRKWGPDGWSFAIDGQSQLSTTFSNQPLASPGAANNVQSFGGQNVPAGSYPAFAGASEVNSLGYKFYRSSYQRLEAMDSVYRLEFTIPHVGEDVRLDFRGFGLQGLTDESWGLDNVLVVAEVKPPVVSVSGATDAEEGGTPGTFTLTRTGDDPTQTLTTYFTLGGNATQNLDYTVAGATYDPILQQYSVTFSTSEEAATSVTVAIVANEDAVFDPDETVELTLAPSPNGTYTTASRSPAISQIADVQQSSFAGTFVYTVNWYAADDEETGEYEYGIGAEWQPDYSETNAPWLADAPAPAEPKIPTADTLEWSDFKVVQRAPKSAFTSGKFLIKLDFTAEVKVTTKGANSIAECKITLAEKANTKFVSVFDPDNSYVLAGRQTKPLLDHERLHLRINEYLAEKATTNLPKDLPTTKTSEGIGINPVPALAASQALARAEQALLGQYKIHYDKLIAVSNKVNFDLYDGQTKGSSVKEKQADWESKYKELIQPELDKIEWK